MKKKKTVLHTCYDAVNYSHPLMTSEQEEEFENRQNWGSIDDPDGKEFPGSVRRFRQLCLHLYPNAEVFPAGK